MTMGMDFKGKTSSAAAKPPISGSVVEDFFGTSDGFSSVVASFSDFSVQIVDLKYPSPSDQNALPGFLIERKYLCQQELS